MNFRGAKRARHLLSANAEHYQKPRCRRSREGGAALTEFVLLASILVPLLFGIAMLGQLIDVRQRAVMAGRFTAWESTIDGHGATSTEIRQRFFDREQRVPRLSADAERTFRSSAASRLSRRADSSESLTDPRSTESANASVVDEGIRADTEVNVRTDAIATFLESSRGTDLARTFGSVIDTAGDTLGGVSGGEWNIEANGLNIGWVGVPVRANGWLPETALVERSVIMNDGWGASGLDHVNRRTRSFVPAGALEVLADALSFASAVPVLAELEGLEGALGHVDASTLPAIEDRRLQPYAERSR